VKRFKTGVKIRRRLEGSWDNRHRNEGSEQSQWQERDEGVWLKESKIWARVA
jgi:hypothetical protein